MKNQKSGSTFINASKIFSKGNGVFAYDSKNKWYPINFHWKPLVELNSNFNVYNKSN